METRSIFSVNTNQTGFKATQMTNQQTQQSNLLHDFYYKLLPTFSKQYPYLSKIFYLQLILRQNILIFTEDRVDARDIWLSLSRMLDLSKPQIYVVNESINMQEILANKNQYQRVMLYDVNKLSVDNINKMLNSKGQISLLGVQSPNCNVGSHISDFFSMIVTYEQEQQAAHLIDTFNQQLNLDSARNFDRKLFNQYVKLNFEIVIQQPDQQGFLKPFLSLFQHKLDQKNIKISQSKWKKMLIILKFIGVNKQEGAYKKLCLGDFMTAPQLLASLIPELQQIRQALYEAIAQFIPYYGIQKFQKSIKNHFWLSKHHAQQTRKIMQKIEQNSISFFYPCIKFPETASVCPNPLSYRIVGYEKKLMSDHHIQVQPTKKYLLKIQVRADSKMIVHFGIACYDKLKTVILPVQACRRAESQVIYRGLDGDKLIVQGASNLQKWAHNSQQNFAYERAIGVYFSGDISQLLPASQVIYNQRQPYSKTNRPYESISIDKKQDVGQITLSAESKLWVVNYKHMLHKHKSVFMNHFEGGVGCIGETVSLTNNQWKSIQIIYEGERYENLGKNFFTHTKYVRIVVMVNYSSGYPNFQISNKNANFQFRNIVFKAL